MQISYQDWSDFLLRVGAICSPAELHGVLCGIQSRGPSSGWMVGVRNYMDVLEDNDMTLVEAAIEAQYDLIGGALVDGQYSLQLLLPDEMLPVAARAKGLALWCQGFLHGFGWGGNALVEQLDDDTQEALNDLAQIAQLEDVDSDNEESEQDLQELVEYARMTLFSVASQLRPAHGENPVHAASATRH